jgi:hypothetical protein
MSAEARWSQLKLVMKFIRPTVHKMKPEDLERQFPLTLTQSLTHFTQS